MLLETLRARLVGLRDTDRPVVVGCSGGADSLALLNLAAGAGCEPVAAYVDHGLRPGAETEADVVREVADTLGVAVVAVPVDVRPGPNLEARARAARYAALESVRSDRGAAATLVGHTADDQAETVLLNLLRGSAGAGLGAMAPRRGVLVRPLLAIRRADTRALCDELGLDPVHDPSNDDRAYRRNWVRHELLPFLAAGAERDLVPVLARQADMLRAESDYLDALARDAWDAEQAGAVALAALPAVVARRVVRQWLGPPPPSQAEVERVLAVAAGERRATELTGGRRVWRRRGRLHADRGTVTP